MAESYGHNRQRPRTEVFLDSSALGSAAATSEKRLVLIGSAQGGEPGRAYDFASFSEARQVFRSGELLDAIQMAWNPSPNQRGAGRIIAMRVEDATQATMTVDGLTVTSRIYGADANGIQVAMEDNETTDSKRFKVYFTKERYERVYDHIGNIFNIQYVGEEDEGTVEVVRSNNRATQLILKAGATGDLQTVRSYELGEGVYEDVNVLINDIDNLPDFEASMFFIGDRNVPSNRLDELAETDVKAEKHVVRAVAGDLERQLRNDPYVEVEIDETEGMPSTVELQNLQGAENGTIPSSWADKFESVADMGAYYIVPLTDKSAIHGELSQFLRDQAEQGNPLRGFVGGGIGEAMEEVMSRQAGLRNSRVSLVGNSGMRRMNDGRLYNFPAYMFAAQVAGLASGLAIGEPITFKHINVESLDIKFSGDQLDQFDRSGVVMVEFVRNRATTHFRIVSEVTTYNSTREPVRNRIGLGEISDFLTTDLRNELDQEFVGSRLQQTSASIMKNAVESFLDRQRNVGGLIVDYRPDDVQVLIRGNQARISFIVTPAQGLDRIDVYITYEDANLAA
jgi:hypothetical protein